MLSCESYKEANELYEIRSDAMLKKYANIIRRLLIIFDASMVAAVFFLAYYVCSHYNGLFLYNSYFYKAYAWVFIAGILMIVCSLYIMGMYNSFRLKTLGEIIWIINKSMFFSFMALSAVLYTFKIEHISRLFRGRTNSCVLNRHLDTNNIISMTYNTQF